MKKRLIAAAVLAAGLSLPVNAGDCPDWPGKRAALEVCRVVRHTFGHAAWRTCVLWVKAQEKECR